MRPVSEDGIKQPSLQFAISTRGNMTPGGTLRFRQQKPKVGSSCAIRVGDTASSATDPRLVEGQPSR